MIEEFIDAMMEHVPPEARIMMCRFRGDPNAVIKGKWRAYVLDNVEILKPQDNIFVCVSAMKKNERGEFRRRKDNFSGGLLLMIDDIGTGKGSKFPLELLEPLPPSAMIETSQDNFQAIYLFNSLVTDQSKFEALIRAFIDKEFLGKDTGMAGVNRVFRPPFGVNGKPKHNGWKVRMTEWNPDRRYSVEEIAEAFELKLDREGARIPRGATANKSDNIRAFIGVRNALREAGMIKREESDLSGWSDVICPWTHEHTGSVDNGAAIKLPDEENSYFGAFKCHHGACETRGWRELTQWISEEQEEVLELINGMAGEWKDYKCN